MSENQRTQRARDCQELLAWLREQRIAAILAPHRIPELNNRLQHEYFNSDQCGRVIAEFEVGHRSLLGTLCSHGRFADVRRYFQDASDLAPGWSGWTPLHYMCEWFSPSLSERWGDRSWTPEAADALHLLLDNGEDLFRPDNTLRYAVTGFQMACPELRLDAWHYLLTRPRNGDQQVMFLELHEYFDDRDMVTNDMRDHIRSCLHHHVGSFRACLEEFMELPSAAPE